MNLFKPEINFEDNRGTISDIFYDTEINHVAVIKTRVHDGKRVIRGNHYHKVSTQTMFMISGELVYWYAPSLNSKDVKKINVPEGWAITTPPLEVHALEFTADAEFIVFATGMRGGKDYESDTYRLEVPILS